MSARLLLVAKAPVAGQAKTRLGATVGMDVAADLAAAALLDTIEVARRAFPGRCHLALAGDLTEAARGAELRDAVRGWHVFAQEGDGFGERLAHAHQVVAPLGPVVQIGMDTPQVTAPLLASAVSALDGSAAVLGPAEDGGWWLLALRDGTRAGVLTDVPMSDPQTYVATVAALEASGSRPGTVASLRDVDTLEDAAAVAAAAPGTRFAEAWRACQDSRVATA